MRVSILVLAGTLAFAASARSEVVELKIGGSGGAGASMKPIAEAFGKMQAEIRPVVLPSLGSTGGITAVASGGIAIGLATRELKEAERATGVKAIEFARSPFVFAVSGSNKATAVSMQDVVRIYAGTLTTWPDGSRLRLVLRPADDSDTMVLHKISDELRQATIAANTRPGMVMAITDSDSVEMIERIPGAFGTATVGHILSENRAVRPLALDGVEPTTANASAAKYPYYKRFFLVIRPDASPAVRKFVAFVQSAPAREILKRNGHWIPADSQ